MKPLKSFFAGSKSDVEALIFYNAFNFVKTLNMVEVFKTNVMHAADAGRMELLLRAAFPDCRFNFDLDDCDKIFRIVSSADVSEQVIAIFSGQQFSCTVLA